MADIASLALEVKSDQVKQANAELRAMGPAASAAERAAQKWSASTKEAGRSSEEFSRRVQATIRSLEFERQQLARNATEQARFAALRRAGVTASSVEGQAITASVRALQAQQAAYELTTARADVYRRAKAGVALAVAAATAIITAFTKQAFDAAAGMDELAEQVGVTARTFQALQFAAAQNGIKFEQLETGISKFSQKMGEAAEGSKEVIESLNRLGVKNLDVQGKLRPTEDLLTDVAKAITAIDDPARRSAAAVDFFGKAGTRMLPVLAQIAQGTDVMATAAERAGAMISEDTTKKLDDFADRLDRAKLIARAWAAEMLASTIDASRAFAEFDDKVTASVVGWFKDVGVQLDKFAQDMLAGGAGAVGAFLESFKAMPDALGKLFIDAWNSAKIATATGINDLTAFIADSKLGRLLGITGGTNIKAEITPGGGFSSGDFAAQVAAAFAQAQAAARAAQQAAADQAAIAAGQAQAGGIQARGAPSGKIPFAPPAVATIGASTSAIKANGSAAEDAEKKYTKLTLQLEQTAKAQDVMTAASARGEVQFQAVKIHLEAQQKALEIYGKVLDDTDPKLVRIEELLTRIAKGKAAEAFNVATTELQKQNVILEAQIALMNEAPEIQAREIALIKAKQEAEKAGTAVTQEMIDARRQAIEQNETLKNQQEELKRAQDLWTEPLKSALQSLQQTAADAFESMLESGKFNFQALGDVFKKIVLRMAAEFLALATVRPVMSVLVNAISPSMAQQFGLSSSGAAGGGGSGLFGGGGSLFGGGGLSFLGNTISGALPSGQFGPPAPGQSFGTGWLDSITWGQGLGALAGAGMGAYQLLSGKGSTGSTIGGIASLVGAGVSLIPGIGQIAGPIIGLLGGILPGLFESKKEPPTLRATGALNFSGGKFSATGGAYNGAESVLGTLGDVGSTMKALLDAAGVGSLSSPNSLLYQTFSKGDFSNATSFVNGQQWGQGSGADAGLDTAAAHIAHMIMLEVDSGISDFMRKGLTGYGQKNLEHAFSTEELATAVSELKSLETIMKDLGRTVPSTETALRAIDEQFKALKESAEKYGLDTTKIVDEQAKARSKIATDFAADLQRQYDDLTGNTTKGALADIQKDYDAAIANNKYLVDNVKDATDQILLIEKLFNEKRTQVAIEMWKTVPVLAREQALFVQRQQLGGQISAMNDNLTNPMARQVREWANERDAFIKSVQDTFGVGSQETFDSTIAAYKKFNGEMKAANDDFIQTMEDGLLDPFELQIKTMMRQRDVAIETARALDTSGKLVEQASLAFAAPLENLAKEMNASVADQLLQMRDPLAFSLKQAEAERDENMRKASLVNNALSDVYRPTIDAIIERATKTDAFGNLSTIVTDPADLAFMQRVNANNVELIKIEELYFEKRRRIEEEYYAQSLSGIEDIIKRLTYGDLSGVSKAATLSGTRGAYQATLAQAMAGDQMGIQNLAGVAEAFVTASRDFYAETSDFFRTTQQVRSDLVAVDANVRGGGGSESSGGLSDAGVAALVGSNRELAESSADENRQLRAELRELKDLLLRKLAA